MSKLSKIQTILGNTATAAKNLTADLLGIVDTIDKLLKAADVTEKLIAAASYILENDLPTILNTLIGWLGF